MYYYDMDGQRQDDVAAEKGFLEFFSFYIFFIFHILQGQDIRIESDIISCFIKEIFRY